MIVLFYCILCFFATAQSFSSGRKRSKRGPSALVKMNRFLPIERIMKNVHPRVPWLQRNFFSVGGVRSNQSVFTFPSNLSADSFLIYVSSTRAKHTHLSSSFMV